MYKSLFEAEKTKIKIAAFRTSGRTGIPAEIIATTKGEALAPVLLVSDLVRLTSL